MLGHGCRGGGRCGVDGRSLTRRRDVQRQNPELTSDEKHTRPVFTRALALVKVLGFKGCRR